jgi:hypothetical protein
MNRSTLDRTRIDLPGRTALVMDPRRFRSARGRTAAGWTLRAHVCPRVFPAHR